VERWAHVGDSGEGGDRSGRLQDTSKPAKGKRGNKKEKGEENQTIVIVFFHRTTIDGESSQKLNKIGKTFSSRCGVYLAISRKDKSIKQKTKAGESEKKDKTFSTMWKKTKVFSKSSPLLKTLLLVLRCLAADEWGHFAETVGPVEYALERSGRYFLVSIRARGFKPTPCAQVVHDLKHRKCAGRALPVHRESTRSGSSSQNDKYFEVFQQLSMETLERMPKIT
jgi:hypothetical protein